MKNLESLLKPKSIAIIGASREKDKIGRIVFDNIRNCGFEGKIYPVNPKAKVIAGIKCYPYITEIPEPVDLAVIAIPAQFVLETIKAVSEERKAKSVIIISAGFSETGTQGFELEYKIKEMLEKNGINLLGPNCLGIISTGISLNATFGRSKLEKGKIAFVSQSGALGTAALDLASSLQIGLSHFISLGNKAGVSENDLLEYFAQEPSVELIALYLEDFTDGKGLVKICRSLDKKVVILKPGSSKEGQKALGSHTGSLAQDNLVITAALEQAGAVRVETIEELFNMMKTYSSSKVLEGRNIGILTNAGGPGVITTDQTLKCGLSLARLEDRTKKSLRLTLPPAASFSNPIDVLGDAMADRYEKALKLIIDDRNVDAVIVLLTPQVMTEVEKTAEVVVKAAKATKKNVFACFLGGDLVGKGTAILERNQIPAFAYPLNAIKTLLNIWKFNKAAARRKSLFFSLKVSSENRLKGKEILENQTGLVDQQLSERLFRLYKIPVMPSFYPVDIADARRGARKIGYPIVAKLIHPALLHKTEAKAVRLDIKNEDDLEQVYDDLAKVALKNNLKDYRVQLQHFVKGALELFIGVKKDYDQKVILAGKEVLLAKGFGHSIIFGLGGIYAEVYKDISFALLPLTEADLKNLMKSPKVSKIILGERGTKYNLEKIMDTVKRIDELISDLPQIKELDINPLFATGKGVWSVDIKMII